MRRDDAWRSAGTLVVLGASAESAGTYQRAGKLGYRTVAVDPRPAVELADEYLLASWRAPERMIAALAGRTDVVGVLSAENGRWISALAELAAEFGERIPAAAVRASTDKVEFRRVCARLGLPAPGWVAGRSEPDLLSGANRLRYPAIVKPANGCGARGVVPCASPAALPRTVADVVAQSADGRVVVEEHVGGTALTVQVLLDDAAVVFSAVSLRSTTPPPYFATTSQLVPASLPDAATTTLLAAVNALADELGYRRGPLTVTAVLGHDGVPYLMGMSTHVGGDGLAEAIESAYGVDVIEAAIAFAVGETVRPHPRDPRPALVRLLSADRAGTLRDVTGVAEVTVLPEVADLQLFTEPGTRVEPYEHAERKLGRVVFSEGTVAALRAADAVVRGTLRLRLADVDEPVALS